MLIDTHAHLNWLSYQTDLAKVIQRAHDIGVKTVINVGTDLATSQQVIDLKSEKINFYAAVGIHPHDSVKFTAEDSVNSAVKKLRQLYLDHQEKVVAIGECGLDYFFNGNPDYQEARLSLDQQKELQKKLYRGQLQLAQELNLPVIIHCRDAWSDIFVPEMEHSKGVFHTFTGTHEDGQKALNLGFYLSFSCIITYPKNESLRQLIKDLPLDRILTETDCPFLPPQQIRGQRNEPQYVKEVVETIANIKGISFYQVAKTTFDNAVNLFKISS